MKMLPLMSPDTCSSQMPLPPLAVISQSVMRMSRPPRQCTRPRRWGRGMLPPSKVMPESPARPAPSPRIIEAPPVKDNLGRAAHADELRAALEAQHAGAVDTRRQRQRHLRARRLIDGALQIAGLVVGAAGPHAILGDVAAKRGGQRCGARRFRRHRERAGNAGGGSPNQVRRLTSIAKNPCGRVDQCPYRRNAAGHGERGREQGDVWG